MPFIKEVIQSLEYEYSSYLYSQQKELTMKDVKYDCIIIGGGISGVSFAHYLHTIGKKALILEQKPNVGGQIHTAHAKQKSGFWRELGSHTCYNSYTYLLSIVKDIKREDIIKSLGKGSYVTYSGGKMKKMFAEMSVVSLFLNGWKMFFVSKKEKTVKQYFSKITGKRNFERLFSYLFRAVICQPADNYPAELFLKHRKDRYKEFPRKYTFNEGISSFIRTVVQEDKIEVCSTTQATSIEKYKDEKESYYKISTDGGESFIADTIALASDPQATSYLLRDINEPLSNLLASIPMFASESLNVVVPKDKLALETLAGIISLSDEFMSAVSRDLVDDPDVRSFTFHFEKGKKSREEKMEIICRVLNITEADIIESAKICHILPALKIEHLGMTAKVDNLRHENDLYILGNYFYGLSIEDCIHRSHDEFERYKTVVDRYN